MQAAHLGRREAEDEESAEDQRLINR